MCLAVVKNYFTPKLSVVKPQKCNYYWEQGSLISDLEKKVFVYFIEMIGDNSGNLRCPGLIFCLFLLRLKHQ